MKKSLLVPELFKLKPIKKILLLNAFVMFAFVSFSQTGDSTAVVKHFSGNISATNNGISLIPSFNLGKPAVVFNLSIGGEKLSFDPQLRFAMEAKPWSFILWWRYKLVQKEKFQMRLGAHPALSFKEINVMKDGNEMEIIRVRRYLAGELAPSFKISKHITLAPYYLYARGIESDITQNTHYIALQSSFSNLKLSEEISMSLTPQIYYLKLDEQTGYYVASGISFVKKDFPFSISGMINKTIDSDIDSKDFIWSVSLVYSFGKKYSELKFQ